MVPVVETLLEADRDPFRLGFRKGQSTPDDAPDPRFVTGHELPDDHPARIGFEANGQTRHLELRCLSHFFVSLSGQWIQRPSDFPVQEARFKYQA